MTYEKAQDYVVNPIDWRILSNISIPLNWLNQFFLIQKNNDNN